jgi:hypothetical protein
MVIGFVGEWVGMDYRPRGKFVAVYEERGACKILQKHNSQQQCYKLSPVTHSNTQPYQ